MRLAALVGVLLASNGAGASPRIADSHRVRHLTTALPRAVHGPFTPLAQRGWRASWDRETGVPAWLWGGRVDAVGAVADAAIAERAARTFLIGNLAVLAPGAGAADFTMLANHLDARGIRTVTFAQSWRGVRVLGGAVGVVIAHDRIFAVRSSAQPDITAAMPGPGLHERAVARVDGGYRVVDIVEEHASSGPERWDVYRDAITGREVGRRSKIMFATGTLEYNAGTRHGGGARTTFPASHASILVNGSPALTMGNGDFTWTGTAPASVVTAVSGTYVRVINSAGASAMATLNVAPGGTTLWDASAVEFDDAQVSTYVYANIAKARARTINPAVIPYLDGQTDFHVNDVGSCNAFSTGDDVHLFRSSTACANTGLVGDVVFHEFGHTLHTQSIIAGIGEYDSHLSEGLSDFFASNITNDPAMGRGFFKSEEPLRQIDPPGFERVYPQDFDFDPHLSGLIIAGALWDLRKQLIAELGAAPGIAQVEQIFTGIMQRADDLSTSFTAALIADDDDADLGNGTPNYCALESTFGRHGLVPGYVMTTVATPVVTGRAISLAVTTPTGTACPPLAVSSVKVTWKANDGVPSELSLVAQGDTWLGEFPELPDGTLITYSVDVLFADASISSFPNNAADPQYQLFIGEGTPLWCESFDTDPTTWEETSNLGREWQWGAPAADPLTPDPDAPFSGAAVFGTDLATTGLYRANLSTVIATPVITIPTFETVRLQYRRWLTVEDAAFDPATIEANGTEIWRNASAQNGGLDHVDREWRYHDIDITPWISDGTLQLRWTLTSDFGKELGGWTLDDVCVVGLAKIPYCGDNDIDANEQCDDGNRDNDDGCSATCIDEVTAGGGGCCASTGDTGSWWLALGVLGWVYRRRRR